MIKEETKGNVYYACPRCGVRYSALILDRLRCAKCGAELRPEERREQVKVVTKGLFGSEER